jgi:phospholipid/cholesterol/gamma-HCH transport system permease protein
MKNSAVSPALVPTAIAEDSGTSVAAIKLSIQPQLVWANAALSDSASGAATLQISGRCTMAQLPQLLAEQHTLNMRPARIDLGQLTAIDSAGALFVLRLLAQSQAYVQALKSLQNVSPEHQSLLSLVAERATASPIQQLPLQRWRVWLEALGAYVLGVAKQTRDLAGFFGAINHCAWRIVRGQRKLRITSVVHHIERTGLNAVPIVSLLCFLVGSVVAFLSATTLRDFGASLLTIEIVSVSFLREFGVLLSAILVAGRSGSAFTAEIGSMRSREEIDAIKALSLDPIELLVIPRLLALLLTLPMLSFIAMLSGILGGALVGAMSLDISPTLFFSRMQEKTELYYLWLGLVKAPVFAFLIAAIGCLEGFKVSGSAESVGSHTTASVVQSIFMVIVFDALFAVLFMQMDL